MRKWIILLLSIVIFFIPFSVDAQMKGRTDFESTGKVFWEAKTDKKIVAITFDDGPHSTYTPQILDLLKKYGAKATFFVTGEQARNYPHLIYREYLDGHEIGNHTYKHEIILKDKPKLKKELHKTSKVIQDITGTAPSLFRPVGGAYNETIISTAIESGYITVLWSWHQDPKDWKRPGADVIANHVISNLTPGDIILLHDSGGDRSQTVEALETILEYLNEQNYDMVTVSELLHRTNAISPE